MFGLGPRELIFVVIIFFLLFGAEKIPDLARGIRDTIKVFRDSFSGNIDSTDNKDKIDKNN